MKCSFAVLHFIMCRHAANVNCHPTLRLTCIISVHFLRHSFLFSLCVCMCMCMCVSLNQDLWTCVEAFCRFCDLPSHFWKETSTLILLCVAVWWYVDRTTVIPTPSLKRAGRWEGHQTVLMTSQFWVGWIIAWMCDILFRFFVSFFFSDYWPKFWRRGCGGGEISSLPSFILV